MSRSSYQFDRWKPREPSTWVFRVFKQHDLELWRMYTAFETARRFTYSRLRGASWEEQPSKHFVFQSPLGFDQFDDMREWSNAFNELENWVNLSALVAISSNLETYVAKIVPLALSSDVGCLYGTPRAIDGIRVLKHGHPKTLDFDEHVLACTKGDWSARHAAYEKLFGRSPKLFSTNIGALERIRAIRNSVAHAVGRDIDASRIKQQLQLLPSERLSRATLLNLQTVVWKLARAIDVHLHQFHIGEYQALAFYHSIYPSLPQEAHPSVRAILLKKRIGSFGANLAGKEFCKGLVKYYEQL